MSQHVRLKGKDTVQCAHCALLLKTQIFTYFNTTVSQHMNAAKLPKTKRQQSTKQINGQNQLNNY